MNNFIPNLMLSIAMLFISGVAKSEMIISATVKCAAPDEKWYVAYRLKSGMFSRDYICASRTGNSGTLPSHSMLESLIQKKWREDIVIVYVAREIE